MNRLFHAIMAFVMALITPIVRIFKRSSVPLETQHFVPFELQFFADPPLEAISEGINISDIEAAVFTTATKSYLFTTASEANAKPAVSQGQEKELRKLNVIFALNKTEDIIKGYDIDLTNVLMHPELLALVNGGVATFSGDPLVFASYADPVAGTVTTRTPGRLDLYTAIKDTDGNTESYLKWAFPECKGKPMDISMKDGDFFMPKLTFMSRPATGSSPLEVTPAAALPTVA